MRLFCFPYAGANARIYRYWEEELPPNIEVFPVEIPGRGSRMAEPLIKDFSILLESIYQDIEPYLDVEFAFFGHSMGALISYSLAQLLRKQSGKQPSLMFISGQRSPELSDPVTLLHTQPDSDLIAELKRLNGTGGMLLDNDNFMKTMLPILRADFAITETFSDTAEPPLHCEMIVFGGLEDEDISRADLNRWQAHSSLPIEVHMLPGDHFFIHSSRELLLRLIARKLKQQRFQAQKPG